MTVTDWLISIAASSAGGAALLTLAGYLGRAHLAHWLNRDLEAVKAKHQRELEQYKTSLVVEVERMKASNDVHKALAIKIAEKRFAAIDELHSAFCDLSTGRLFTSINERMSEPEERQKCLIEVWPRTRRFETAILRAQMFLTSDEVSKLMMHRISVGDLAMYVSSKNLEFYYEEFQRKEEALGLRETVCSDLLQLHLDRLFKMTEAK
jgi:hypothetical protein